MRSVTSPWPSTRLILDGRQLGLGRDSYFSDVEGEAPGQRPIDLVHGLLPADAARSRRDRVTVYIVSELDRFTKDTLRARHTARGP